MIELMDRRGEREGPFISNQLVGTGEEPSAMMSLCSQPQIKRTGITEKGKKHFFVIFLCFFHISAIEYIHYNKRKLSSSSSSWWGGAGAATGNEKEKKKKDVGDESPKTVGSSRKKKTRFSPLDDERNEPLNNF